MKTIKYALISASCMALMACDESFDGTLNLQQPITLKIKNGDLVIPMGSQRAVVKADSKKIKLKITINGQEQSVEFKLPKNSKVRSFNDLNLTPEASGQPYTLKGDENTEYTDSQPTRTRESCSFNRVESQCGYERTPVTCTNQNICDVPGNPNTCRVVQTCTGGDSRYVCRNVNVTHYGSKDVEYYYTYAETTRHVQVIDPASQQSIGLFTNVGNESIKHYNYEGMCLEDRPW